MTIRTTLALLLFATLIPEAATQVQCDDVRAMQPDAGAPPGPAPSAADVARLACRVDLTRERIEDLK